MTRFLIAATIVAGVMSTSATATAGGAPMNCTEACDALWTCMLQNNNCPNVMVGDELNFKAGCTSTCQSQPVLIQLVNPNDCSGTVQTLSALSSSFAAYCGTQGGVGGGGVGGGGVGGAGVGGSGECPGAENDCNDICSILFCCAEPRCDGFTPADETSFLAGCVPNCRSTPALGAIVDGSQCDTTVDSVKAVSMDFAEACDGMGGAGGTPGAGGGSSSSTSSTTSSTGGTIGSGGSAANGGNPTAPNDSDSGCSCRVPAAPQNDHALFLLALAGALAFRRRK